MAAPLAAAGQTTAIAYPPRTGVGDAGVGSHWRQSFSIGAITDANDSRAPGRRNQDASHAEATRFAQANSRRSAGRWGCHARGTGIFGDNAFPYGAIMDAKDSRPRLEQAKLNCCETYSHLRESRFAQAGGLESLASIIAPYGKALSPKIPVPVDTPSGPRFLR